MKTWNVHCGVRLTKDYIIKAETYDEANRIAVERFENEPYDDMEWVHDDYDQWEIKPKFEVGDTVRVIDSGFNYPTYYSFFEKQGLSIDIASRYAIGGSPIVNGKYKVLYIDYHQIKREGKLYVIESMDETNLVKYVHLIGENGIEKVED